MCLRVLGGFEQDIERANVAGNSIEEAKGESVQAIVHARGTTVGSPPPASEERGRELHARDATRTLANTTLKMPSVRVSQESTLIVTRPASKGFISRAKGDGDREADMAAASSFDFDDELFADFASQSVPLQGLAEALKKRMAIGTGEDEGADGLASSPSPPSSSSLSSRRSTPKRKMTAKITAKKKEKKKEKNKKTKRANAKSKAKTKGKTKTKSKKTKRVKLRTNSRGSRESPTLSPRVRSPRRARRQRSRPHQLHSRKSDGASSLVFSPKERRGVQHSTRMASRLSALRRSMERMSMLSAASGGGSAIVSALNGNGREDAQAVVAAFGSSVGLDLLFEGTAARARRALAKASGGEGRAKNGGDDPAAARAAASYARAFADGLRKSLEGPRLAAIAARLEQLEQRIQAAVAESDEHPGPAGVRMRRSIAAMVDAEVGEEEREEEEDGGGEEEEEEEEDIDHDHDEDNDDDDDDDDDVDEQQRWLGESEWNGKKRGAAKVVTSSLGAVSEEGGFHPVDWSETHH